MPLTTTNDITQQQALKELEHRILVGPAGAVSNFGDYHLHSVFQPIYSISHRRPIGYEALVRANDLNSNSISPARLFAGCQSMDQIVHLDRLCRATHILNFPWEKSNDVWLFLNVEPNVILNGKNFGPFFSEFLKANDIPPEQIVIEILEGVIQDETQLASAVDYYKNLGCLIAIDDFGAGHSNFQRIWELSPHLVKLDRHMIVRATKNKNARRTLPQLVELMHESGSMVVIEGIETEDQALLAVESNVDFVQGYLFGRPQFHTLAPPWQAFSNICDRLKNRTNNEDSQYQLTLNGYKRTMQGVMHRLEAGEKVSSASSELLEHDQVERCYLLDSHGRQIGHNLIPSERSIDHDLRFSPLARTKDAVWTRREYFRNAIERPRQIQVTKPYLSISGSNMCVTMSVAFPVISDLQVFCCDLILQEP
ncbi:EAL domain-containing protein [Acidihalobacter prosperus]